MNRIGRNIKKTTSSARSAGFLKLRNNVGKNPLNEIEISALIDYLSLETGDSAKDAAWTLAFTIEPRDDILTVSENVCKKLPQIKDEDIEISGASTAVWYFLKKCPEKLGWVILKGDQSQSVKIKEIIADIAFCLDQFQGVKQWAKLYAYAKEPYHPWAHFEMDLYHRGSQKLLKNIKNEIRSIKLKNFCDEELADVYIFFQNVLMDGLKNKKK